MSFCLPTWSAGNNTVCFVAVQRASSAHMAADLQPCITAKRAGLSRSSWLLQMVCSRCPTTADMTFASDAVSSGNQQGRGGGIQVSAQCSNCHQDWSACLTPRLVHAHSNVLASLRSLGCSPLDLLPSLMAAQCSNCSAAASLR